jgi:2-keto-4-pentenoate hydratase
MQSFPPVRPASIVTPGPAIVLAAALLALAGCASSPGPSGTSAAPKAIAPADCPDDANIALQVNQYLAMLPIPNPPPSLSIDGATCSARKFVQALSAKQGRVVGYKAGLTTTAMQQRFNVASPLRGVLLEKMLVKDGDTVPAKFGAVPFVESDLIVEVGSAAINDAKTPAEVLASLRAVIPFIELPDRLFTNPNELTAAALIAGNVGARMGVLGQPVPVRNDAAFAAALRDMSIRMVDGAGKVSVGKGSDILGDPLNAVLFIAADLKKHGMALKPGDLLSLGGFGVGAAAPGQSARVTYEGLPGNPSVTVKFQ